MRQLRMPDRHALAAFCTSTLVGLAAQWPALANPFMVNDDVRQQLFWMRRWLDPALYPPDILNQYAQAYVPWGVAGVYRLAALALDPLFFSKLLAALLLGWLGALFFSAGRALRTELLGLLALGLFWLSPCFMENISGGLARAFAAPLLLLFLHAQLVRSRRLALAALLAQALCIPYILLPCLGAAALHWAAWRGGLVREAPPLRHPADALAALAALGLAVAWQSGLSSAGFGPLPWLSEAAGRPEFGAAGRLDLLPLASPLYDLLLRPWGAFAPFREGGPWAGGVATALLLPLLALGARRADWRSLRPQAPALACMAAASLGLYILARLLAFKLFVPSRYVEYAANTLLCLGLALCLEPLLRGLLDRLGQGPRRALGGVLLALALCLGAARQYGLELYDYSGQRALYALASATPKDARFAGHPQLMDNLLTFGRRNVYASFELAHPWSAGYWAVVGKRLEGQALACYTGDPEELLRFCRQEGIDFLVADRRHYSPQFLSGRPLFEPFGELIRRQAAKPLAGGGFAVFSGRFPGTWVDADTLVLDMRAARAGVEGAPK